MPKTGTYFENILRNAESKGITKLNTAESIKWFRENVRKTTTIDTNRLMKEEAINLVNAWTNVGVGRMYFVHYDPKHKKTLPYYDTFPMMIPIKRYDDGLLGLNLHYLPPILRAKLLDALYDTINNDKFDETTKMRINYQILKSASKYKWFEPCIKRYLGKHFRSRFMKVDPKAWSAAVFLPVEKFEKETKAKIWSISKGGF